MTASLTLYKLARCLMLVVILLVIATGCASSFSLPEDGGSVEGDSENLLPQALEIYSPNLIAEYQTELEKFSAATRYDIQLEIGGDISLVKGFQEVIYTNNESVSLSEIYFRLFPNVSGSNLVVRNVKADGQPVEFSLEHRDTALWVILPDVLQPGDSVTLSMDFSQNVPETMGGNYGLYIYLDNILALDAFFPIIPVYNEEGWQVEDPPRNADMIYADAAFFKVQVSAPENLVLVASGVEVESKQEKKYQLKTFVAGPQRDFYLAASPRFVSQSLKVNETLVTSFYPSDYEEMGKMVLQTAAKALEIYSERLGEYPYTELDLVSTPMQAGGMEYSSVAAMALNFYQPGSAVNGVSRRAFLESATAHEVAHQWFFNQVMNDQLDEPWLDEGFAQYLTYLYFLDAYGESAADSYLESWKSRWERVNFEEIPIGKPAGDYESYEYSPIIYGRAPIFIRELENEMGAKVFAAFLKDYVSFFRWGIVNTADFRSMAETACECDLSDLFDKFWAVE